MIRILRQMERTLLRSNHDGRRRLVEVKKRMDILPPGQDLLHVARLEQLARFSSTFADLGENVYPFRRSNSYQLWMLEPIST